MADPKYHTDIMAESTNFSTDDFESEFVGEKEWFFLYWIAKFGENMGGQIPTPDLCDLLHISQQTISRRIIDLEKQGYITRSFHKNGGLLKITSKGMAQLQNIFFSLQRILLPNNHLQQIRGKVKSGMGEGGYYIQLPNYVKQFRQKLNITPYKGTLNLEFEPMIYQQIREEFRRIPPTVIAGFTDENRTYGNVNCFPAEIYRPSDPEKRVPCAILLIERTSHSPRILEIIAEPYLREYFNLKDDDELEIRLEKKPGC
jgi:riboflavin kinase